MTAPAPTKPDLHGNVVRRNHVDRCWCGCKYWRHDRCIDCGDSGDGAVDDT